MTIHLFDTRKDAWNNEGEKKGGGHPAFYSGEDSEFLLEVCTTMRRLHFTQIVGKSPITVAYLMQPIFSTKV